MNTLHNYAIAQGRTSGRFETLRNKGMSYGRGNAIGLDDKQWNRFLNLITIYGGSVKRGEITTLIRRSIKPVMLAAQREAGRIEATPGYSGVGNLYDSIGMFTGRSRKFPNVQIGARIQKGFKGYHAFMVEHGTEMRRNKKGSNRGRSKANPFMQPAFDKTLGSVRPAFEKEIAAYIQKKADKVFK
jgi:hypothetical protein